MKEGVLYLMIVNMPSEAELAQARRQLERARGCVVNSTIHGMDRVSAELPVKLSSNLDEDPNLLRLQRKMTYMLSVKLKTS